MATRVRSRSRLISRMTDPYSEKLNQAVMIFDFDNRGAWPKMDAITPTRG